MLENPTSHIQPRPTASGFPTSSTTPYNYRANPFPCRSNLWPTPLLHPIHSLSTDASLPASHNLRADAQPPNLTQQPPHPAQHHSFLPARVNEIYPSLSSPQQSYTLYQTLSFQASPSHRLSQTKPNQHPYPYPTTNSLSLKPTMHPSTLLLPLVLLPHITLATPHALALGPGGGAPEMKDALDGIINLVRGAKGQGLMPGSKAYGECKLEEAEEAQRHRGKRSAKGGKGGGGGKRKGGGGGAGSC
ncbi:hypothetical protein MMC18_004298 [Xylographa bjoerkii]|nr:hypothetical protein [Xylographa bjoerkii]